MIIDIVFIIYNQISITFVYSVAPTFYNKSKYLIYIAAFELNNSDASFTNFAD